MDTRTALRVNVCEHVGSKKSEQTTRISISSLSGIIPEGPDGRLEIGSCLLLKLIGQGMNFETIKTGNKMSGWRLRAQLWMNHKEHVRETSPEIGPIGVMMTRRFGIIDIHTFRAIKFNHSLVGNIREAYGQHGLIFTVDSWAIAEITILIFLYHLSDSSIGEDIARMDES